MDEEVVVKMEGNLEQLTVGGMVEIVKQNMSQVVIKSNVGDQTILAC